MDALSQLVEVCKDVLQQRRFGLLPSEDHTGPQDNGVLEIELLDGILDANFHLREGQVDREETSGPCAGDENVRLHSRLLGRFGVLYAQVMVDLPLILDSAGCRSCGADCVEDDRWLGRQGGDHAAPFRDVAFPEGLELGRLSSWQSP